MAGLGDHQPHLNYHLSRQPIAVNFLVDLDAWPTQYSAGYQLLGPTLWPQDKMIVSFDITMINY